MAFHPVQFRKLVKDTLVHAETMLPKEKYVKLSTCSAVELLVMTAAQESLLGRYLSQLGGGPALGIFQIELNTYQDLFVNYLRYRPYMSEIVDSFTSPSCSFKLQLKANIPLQIVLARLLYLRHPTPLPSYPRANAIAEYYKKYWNTSKGEATVDDVLRNYRKYAQ